MAYNCAFMIKSGSLSFEEWRVKAEFHPRIGETVTHTEKFHQMSKEQPTPGIAKKTYKVVDVVHTYGIYGISPEVVQVYLEQQGETIIEDESIPF